jgi:hypothetical protein
MISGLNSCLPWYAALAAAGLLVLGWGVGGDVGRVARAAAVANLVPTATSQGCLIFTVSVVVFFGLRQTDRLTNRTARPEGLAAAGLLVLAAIIEAAKQTIAGSALAAAAGYPARVVCWGGALAAAMLWTWGIERDPRYSRWSPVRASVWTAFGGTCLVAIRIALAPPDTGFELAQRVDATAWFYDEYAVSGGDALARRLVTAVPTRDEAANRLSVDEALASGWRPRRAGGRVVEVAGALWERGRGGEAVRLLRRHPREREVDGLLALFERFLGEPVGWRGGQIGIVLSGVQKTGPFVVPAGGERRSLYFTATNSLRHAAITVENVGIKGAIVDVTLDGRSLLHTTVDKPTHVLLGPIEAGPHVLRLSVPPDQPAGQIPYATLEIALQGGD